MAPAQASRPPGRALLRLAGVLTQLLCAGCLLLGTIAFVLVQQHRMDGSGLVLAWSGAALVGLVFGVLMGRGGLLSLVLCAVLDAAFGVVLLALEYEALGSLLRLLPESDVQMIADVVTGVGAALLVAFALCLLAIPQALRYTRWMHAETEPRLASSTARGFPPPPIPAGRGSVWSMPIVALDESRSRRRMYFALAGFAIGFGAGIGVLVSSTSQRSSGAVASPARTGGGSGSATSSAAGAGGSGGSAGSAGSGGSGAIAAAGTFEAGSAAPVPPDGSPGVAPTFPRNDAGSGSASTPLVGQGEPVTALIQAQRAALEKGDLAALGRLLAPGAFGFGVDADEVAEGRDAALLQLRKDLGELVRDGASVEVKYSSVGEARDHAWIALELEVAAAGRSVRRFAVSELAAKVGGAWTIVAWHWATPVLDKTAERMALLGTKPTPKPIPSVLTGPKGLEDAVRTAFGSRRAFAAARSEHDKAFNFGSAPSERSVGGTTIKRVFSQLRAEIRLHDGVRIVGAGAWDPAQKDAPTVAFAAANVDFKTKTRAATDLTHTFRVLAVLVLEDGAWKIVQTQWSHGGPVR